MDAADAAFFAAFFASFFSLIASMMGVEPSAVSGTEGVGTTGAACGLGTKVPCSRKCL